MRVRYVAGVHQVRACQKHRGMMMARRKTKDFLAYRPHFGVGDLDRLVAEADEDLAQYYIGEERFVARAENRNDPASVFIGPKGVGKSAVLQMVRLRQRATGDEERVIEIAPDDLAFNALVNIDARTPLLSSPRENIWLFTSLWDYVLSVAVLEREPTGAGGIVGMLQRMFENRFHQQQKELLSLTLRDDGSRSTMTDKMLALVEAIELQGSYGGATGTAKVELADERPSGKAEDLKLLQLINNVAKQLPHNIQHEYYILIDDLDLHWTGTELQNAFLGAMFLSIRRLSRSRQIKFVVSMRKNIYRQVDLEERDKFANMVCEVSWGKADIKRMVQRRLAYVLAVWESEVWGPLFPDSAFDQMWSSTDGMPRELIRVATECVKVAQGHGHRSIEQTDMEEATKTFSEGRLDDLASLYVHQYPGLGVVTQQFRGGPKQFDSEHLREVGFHVADIASRTPGAKPYSWAEVGVDDPLQLARILLGTGFLQLKSGRTASPHTATEDEIESIGPQNWYAVHPMYQSGLELVGS